MNRKFIASLASRYLTLYEYKGENYVANTTKGIYMRDAYAEGAPAVHAA